MKPIRTGQIAASLALLCPALGWAEPAKAPAPRLIVSYVEAAAGRADKVAAELQAYAAEARRSPGHPQVEVLREIGRPNRMLVIEHWADLQGDPMDAVLQAKVGADIEAPFDRRINDPITPPIAGPIPRTAFQMAMHVDVVPEASDEANAALAAQRAAVLAAPGALGYEASVQDNRHNHFAIHEAWASRAAYEAYVSSQPAEALRQKLTPIKGALYDDRFYAELPAS